MDKPLTSASIIKSHARKNPTHDHAHSAPDGKASEADDAAQYVFGLHVDPLEG